MKPETIIIIRKLAREATIFALLGMALGAIGAYVFMDYEDRTNAIYQATIAVHGGMDWNVHAQHSQPTHTVQVPLTNGAVLYVRRCEPDGPWTKYATGKDDTIKLPPGYEDAKPVVSTPECRKFITDPIAIRDSVPLGNADQVAIEKDYWAAYKKARHYDLDGQLLGSLYVGLLGFPAGLVLWIFYRLVRFAVKG